ncbi:hypothetical protein HYZ64_01250 [Candidatus Berkelbacteria bacterium]|nr:hypothetical protein [Candidatus Berkelbacteria bacterium]
MLCGCTHYQKVKEGVIALCSEYPTYSPSEHHARRWMVQGNRKQEATSPEALATRRLGELAAQHSVVLKVGAYGEVVKNLGASGATIVCHTCHSEPRDTKIPSDAVVSDCYGPASQIGGNDITAWFIRLDQMTRGIDAAIYFPGGPGTRLHMTPIGFNLANLSRGRELYVPKVAFIGWRPDWLQAMVNFWGAEFNYDSFGCHQWAEMGDSKDHWLASFDISGVEAMVEWLLGR